MAAKLDTVNVDNQIVAVVQPPLHQLLRPLARRLGRVSAHRRLADPRRVGHLAAWRADAEVPSRIRVAARREDAEERATALAVQNGRPSVAVGSEPRPGDHARDVPVLERQCVDHGNHLVGIPPQGLDGLNGSLVGGTRPPGISPTVLRRRTSIRGSARARLWRVPPTKCTANQPTDALRRKKQLHPEDTHWRTHYILVMSHPGWTESLQCGQHVHCGDISTTKPTTTTVRHV